MLRTLLVFLTLELALAVPVARAADSAPAPARVEAAASPMVLTLILGDPETSEMGFLGNAFKTFVEKSTNHAVEVKLSYGGGLGEDETFQFHRAQTGKLDMALGGVGNLVPMVKPLGVLTLPYLFFTLDEVVRGTTGKPAELLNACAEEAGLRILAWTYCGFRYISNSKHPIKTMADMKGLRFRVPQSIAMIESYRAFGGLPSTIAWPMTWNALKYGLVDGQCYDYSGFQAMKFKDAGQKYITEVHYMYNLQPLVMSERVFRQLSPDLQKILVEGGQYAQKLSLQYQRKNSEEAKQALEKDGVIISSLQDEGQWRAVAREQVWPHVAESVGGREHINAYLEACGLPLWNPPL
ncbi:MAG: TRAP transporter substrate-binding protein [Desulfovibrionaceae bacterium]|nr:TRAP transporter substrate-binding protein [Desulfovibrionaceae bacterium]